MIATARLSTYQPLPLPGWKTASGGLQPWTRRRVGRSRLQATDASGKKPAALRPRAAGTVLPEKQGPDLEQPSFSQCLLASAKKNIVSLTLDAAGALIPGVSAASTLGKLGVGGAALVNSAVTTNPDRPGGFVASVGLGIADFHLSSAAPLVQQYRNVSNVAKAVPFIGNLVSLTAAGLDIYNAYGDYQDCRAGK